MNEPKPLDQLWSCRNCSQTMRLGDMPLDASGFHCRHCGSDKTEPVKSKDGEQ